MRTMTEEKLEIINKVLYKYFNSPAYKKTKKCNKFKAEVMAAYIEKKLNPEERKRFEKHLFICKYCLNIYTNLKNEINLFFKTKLKKISKELLTEALHFVEEESKKYSLGQTKSKFIVKIRKKGIELIEAINFNKIKPIPVPILRGQDHALLKEIFFEADYNSNFYQLKVQSYSNDMINLKINFPDKIYNLIKGSRLNIRSKDTKISKNIKKDMSLDELPKGNYKLLIDHSILINLEVI